jgi:hypothetical protein
MHTKRKRVAGCIEGKTNNRLKQTLTAIEGDVCRARNITK